MRSKNWYDMNNHHLLLLLLYKSYLNIHISFTLTTPSHLHTHPITRVFSSVWWVSECYEGVWSVAEDWTSVWGVREWYEKAWWVCWWRGSEWCCHTWSSDTHGHQYWVWCGSMNFGERVGGEWVLWGSVECDWGLDECMWSAWVIWEPTPMNVVNGSGACLTQ